MAKKRRAAGGGRNGPRRRVSRLARRWAGRGRAAYSDRVKAQGFDGKYYPGLEAYLGDKGAPDAIFERSCDNIHNSGNLLLHMANAGFVGDYFGRFCSRPSAEWPPGSNNEYLFMAGLWVGAVDADGNPRVDRRLRDRVPARLPGYSRPHVHELRGRARRPARAPGTRLGRLTTGRIGGWPTPPHQRGFPQRQATTATAGSTRTFEAISQQMFSCEYTDYGEISTQFFNEHVPLPAGPAAELLWSSGGAENMVGIDYKIWNDGTRRCATSTSASSTPDVGPADADEYPNMYLDDLVGFTEIDTTILDLRPSTPASCRSTQVKLQLGYMRDLPDAELTGITESGDVPGWFGGLFLGHSTDPAGLVAPPDVGIRTFVWFAQGGSIRDPENDFERYELLSRNAAPPRAVHPGSPRTARLPLRARGGAVLQLLPTPSSPSRWRS
jgi:hypothetical protein